MLIKAYNANEAYEGMKKLIKSGSIESSPRGMKIKERLGISVRIHNPRDRIITGSHRNFPIKSAFAEFLWYMTGNPSVKIIYPYLKHWKNYSDNEETVNSNYGFQWKNQIKEVIEKIKKDSDTRQAVVNLYHDDYSVYYGKDTVCTPSFQFLLREDLLYLIVNARSRDLVRGECIDQFTFTLLQEIVANELGVQLGWYQVNIGSLHIYEEHFNLLETQETYDGTNKESVPIRTFMNYSNFWNLLKDHKDTDLSNDDFILFLLKEKQIDFDSFYKGWKDNIYFPKVSPMFTTKREIF
jgi:thymidylate synthase